jgi:DNA invertase Pin-like site-specific DNA recombinase
MTPPTTTAREYQRVSKVIRGNDRSPEEQHGDNARHADRHGWDLGPAYRDKVSASRYGRKVREDWQRLVTDLQHDRFGASVLILWESSRGSRQMSEWVQLLELCEKRGVKIYVTADSKLYDPADARDRRSLLEDAIDAEYESAKTSKRTRRSAASTAKDGKPGPGLPPYGYRRVYDPTSGRRVGQEIEPAEAEVVVELYRRLKAGHSLRTITSDFEARGIRTRDGRPFIRSTLRAIALNRAYIGERVHDPDRDTVRQGHLSPRAVISTGVWPPIVDGALWTAVYQLLTDEERLTRRPGRATHWLAGIAVCDVCSGPMRARVRKDMAEPEMFYVCHRATHVTVPYTDLEEHAEMVLLAYLTRDDVVDTLTATPEDPVALAAAEADLAAVERDIDDLADRAAAGGPVAKKLLDRNLPILEERLAAAKARRDNLTAPPRLGGLIDPGDDVIRQWVHAPMTGRREIARIVFVPDLRGELRIVRGLVRDPIETRVSWRTAE